LNLLFFLKRIFANDVVQDNFRIFGIETIIIKEQTIFHFLNQFFRTLV